MIPEKDRALAHALREAIADEHTQDLEDRLICALGTYAKPRQLNPLSLLTTRDSHDQRL